MRTLSHIVLVALTATALLSGAGITPAAHADPAYEQVTSDEGRCRVPSGAEVRDHVVRVDYQAPDWTPIRPLYHPTWDVVGGTNGGRPHVVAPGTQLRFAAHSAQIESAWLAEPNGAGGVNTIAGKNFPLPGARKFAVIGVYLDPETRRPLDIDGDGVRNGRFLIGKRPHCRTTPNVPVVVGIMTNDDDESDGVRRYTVDVQEVKSSRVSVGATTVDRSEVRGHCADDKAELRFSATITGKPDQLVKYRWYRSGREHTDIYTIVLPSTGRFTAEDTWVRGRGRGLQALEVIEPERKLGKAATFFVDCDQRPKEY